MTNASTGAAARLHALPSTPLPDPSTDSAAAAPVATTRTLGQVDALDTFVRSITSNNGSGDAARLRLLFGDIHPDDRPIALQVLGPFRESTRRHLIEATTSRLDTSVDELRRQHVRLQEIGVKLDTNDLTTTVETSAVALDEFRADLQHATEFDDIGPRLRDHFTHMTTHDRRVAQQELAAVRSDESRRVQGLLMSNNGEVDPSEYLTLRRLANVDAPVEPWEVPTPPAAAVPYNFAAGM